MYQFLIVVIFCQTYKINPPSLPPSPLIGTYRPHSDSQYFCLRCKTGYYQLDLGKTKCNICPEGSYCPYASSEPRQCPPDARCPEGSHQPAFCKSLYAYSSEKDVSLIGGGLTLS